MPLKRLWDRKPQGVGYRLTVLGDHQAFSPQGKNPCYFLEWGENSLLVDLGTSPFQALTPEQLHKLDGVLITHLHLDHCRYFSDLALYSHYILNRPLKVIAGFMTLKRLREMFELTLVRTLDSDLGKTKSLRYEDFVQEERIGPMPRAEIVNDPIKGYRIRSNGPTVLPAKFLKGIGGRKNNCWHLIYYSTSFKGWVEPNSFFSYENPEFYYDPRAITIGGLTFRIVNAHTWHGLDVDGLIVDGWGTRMFLTSDTVYNQAAWKRLLRRRRAIKAQTLSKEKSQFIEGEVEDYIEQFWGEDRYNEAFTLYETPLILHDVGAPNSVVHTEYKEVLGIKSRLFLIHTPDNFLSAVPFLKAGAAYQVENNELFELVGGIPKTLDADLYLKEGHRYLVGFGHAEGEYSFAGLRRQQGEHSRRDLTHVRLFLDMEGHYLPWPIEKNQFYHLRESGKPVLIEETPTGVQGRLVADLRDTL